MAASFFEIRNYFREAEKMGATHLIMMVDEFDYEDYPVFVMPGKNPRELGKYQNMQRSVECYKISLGWEAQAYGIVQNWD